MLLAECEMCHKQKVLAEGGGDWCRSCMTALDDALDAATADREREDDVFTFQDNNNPDAPADFSKHWDLFLRNYLTDSDSWLIVTTPSPEKSEKF